TIHGHDRDHDRWTSEHIKKWWSLSGSNRRPEACKATALPAELRPLFRFGLRRRQGLAALAALAALALSAPSGAAAGRPSQPVAQDRRSSVASPTAPMRAAAKATDGAAGL